VAQLRSMIDAGKLKVVIRDGRMIIALPNDVLFDSGKTVIKPDGQAALAQVALVLAGIPDRHFLVAGDTDDVPIHSSRFPSNWELSTARAVEVVKLLVDKGVKPEMVAAAGYGQFDPIVANDTPEHRAQNRRIEIVLQPNLADLPSLEVLRGKFLGVLNAPGTKLVRLLNTPASQFARVLAARKEKLGEATPAPAAA